MRWFLIWMLFSLGCRAQHDTCSPGNDPYPSPPFCENFPGQDSVEFCYRFTAPDNMVYLNPYILTSCGTVNLEIFIMDSTCQVIDTGQVGYNPVTAGATYHVCFHYTCDLSGGIFSGICFFDYLPIELLYFDAKKVEQVVQLDWATASETNNDFFAVERSGNGKNFHRLSIIDGAGNSSTRQDYSYTDFVPYQEGNYYQLAQQDYDGKVWKSQIRYVSMKNNPDIEVYDVTGNLLFKGRKKDFTPVQQRVYIVLEEGRFKKYVKP